MPRPPKPDMSAHDRDVLLTMIKSRIEKPGYSDKDVAAEANKKSLVTNHVTPAEIARIRSDEGLRKRPGRRGSQSKKYQDPPTSLGGGTRQKRGGRKPKSASIEMPHSIKSNGSGEFKDAIAMLEAKRDAINTAIESLKAL